MLTAKPRKSKYTLDDVVYRYNNGQIETHTINKVLVLVANPDNTTNGEQINQYGLVGVNGYFDEDTLFVKPNACLQRILQPDKNKASGYMEHLIIPAQYEGFASGFITRDLTGVTMEDSTVPNAVNPDYTGCFVDNASFHNWAQLWIPSRLQFIEDVASYDKKYTLWEETDIDGKALPIVDRRGKNFIIAHNSGEEFFSGCMFENAKFNKPLSLSYALKSEVLSWADSYDELTTIWVDGYPVIDCRNIVFTGNLSAVQPGTSQIIFDVTDRKFEGAVFTGCTMPTNADTKAEFKALAGSWDAVTTIWTDGLPIGA